MTPDDLAYCTQAVNDVLRRHGYDLSSCILGTRILLDVLAYYGVDAKAQPVRVMALNESATDQIRQGIAPKDWPEEAWSVGVDDRQPLGPDVSKGYPGHLVVLAEGLLLDPTADQLDRPQRGLRVRASVTAQLPEDFFDPEGYLGLYDEETGTRLIYEPSDLKPSTWTTAPDWIKSNKRRPLVAEAIRQTKEWFDTGLSVDDPDTGLIQSEHR